MSPVGVRVEYQIYPKLLVRAIVEVLGIEPRSISFLVNILRAQLTGYCRDRDYC